MENNLQNSKRTLVIDTCVIQMISSSDKQKVIAVRDVLAKLSSDYILTISTVSVYEHLYGLWGKKAKSGMQLLKAYEWKQVSEKVLQFAAILGGLYREEQVDYMSARDKIVAATAVLEHGFILTENHRDFPHPFFVAEKSIPITYLANGKYNKTIDLAIYKPDFLLIARRIEELDKINS